jgi:tetratricopeptide (TPR) repeat protein
MNTTLHARALDERQAAEHRRATAALQAGESAVAHGIAHALLSAAPNAPDALQLMALCHADAGRHADADRCMAEALALSPGQPMLLANRAALLRRAGRLADAQAAWQAAAEASPDDASRWRSLGTAAVDNRDTEAALAAMRRACALQPADAANWRALGLALCEARRWQRATAVFLRALQIDPEDAPTWVHLATAMRFIGRADRSLECLERARQLGYTGRELSHAVVGALVDLGRADEARQQAERLVTAHASWPEAHRTLAQIRWEYDEPGQADPFSGFRAAVAAHPADRALRWELARLLIEAREADEALRLLHPLLDEDDRPVVRLQIANAHDARGDNDSAAEWYAQALRGFGDAAPADVLNAWCRHLLKTGRWDEARAAAERALRQSPFDQEAWAYLGTAWRLLGDPREHWLCDPEQLVGFVPIELPPGHADMASFLSALRAAIEPLHRARREPVHQSVRGGSQTSGRLFGRADPVIEAAAQALKAAVQRWVGSLPDDPEHPFLSRRHGVPEFTGSWSVKLWSSGRHANHMHTQGWMSSAFYIALPPSVATAAEGNAGCIQFGSPPVELGLDLPPQRIVHPREGWLALFPSYLWHGTVPFADTEPRITAAFDVVMLPPA